MKAKIEIEMNGAAFDDAPASELARILRAAAAEIEAGELPGGLRDINGNTVGKLEVIP